MSMSRRSFLIGSAGGVISSGVSGQPRHSSKPISFDPDFGTATDAVRAIESRIISSEELLKHVLDRIDRFNSGLNAFVTLNEEKALEAARFADRALARGIELGPLHGLPVLVKDSFSTSGLRTTSGSRLLVDYIPENDAVAVARLKRAGAVIIGKTNLPEFASDLQSYNDIAGTTNNPWDPKRTPGGSTGGGAAALAAGFGFLELGSDIGGSIRTPCHFCGVYGHKPTIGIVPIEGHIPPPPNQVAVPNNLGVAGPLARGARDLLLELNVLAGPTSTRDLAYSWKLPETRSSNLRDFKIGFVLDDPFCPVTSDVSDVLAQVIEELSKKNIMLKEGWPDGYKPAKSFNVYLRLLAAAFAEAITDEELQVLRASSGQPWKPYADLWLEGLDLSHASWTRLTALQIELRKLWQRYFGEFDAFLMPENFLPAFEHDHSPGFFERKVQTRDGTRQYGDMMAWISTPTLTGCPATVAPVGRTGAGLPVGIQIMGPFLEDSVSIQLAELITDLIGGFEAPPAFKS